MGLFELKDLPNGSKLGIWHITESLPELLKIKIFSAEELDSLSTFANEHRKKEFLVARILLEKISGKKDIRISYDTHNKPRLENFKGHISITHSRNLLAVFLDKSETGIDIELLKEKIKLIKHKFMSDTELANLKPNHITEQLTIYWCVKESLYKLYGKKELTFKANLIVGPFTYSEKGTVKGWIKKESLNKSHTLNYELIKLGGKQFMLTYILS